MQTFILTLIVVPGLTFFAFWIAFGTSKNWYTRDHAAQRAFGWAILSLSLVFVCWTIYVLPHFITKYW